MYRKVFIANGERVVKRATSTTSWIRDVLDKSASRVSECVGWFDSAFQRKVDVANVEMVEYNCLVSDRQ